MSLDVLRLTATVLVLTVAAVCGGLFQPFTLGQTLHNQGLVGIAYSDPASGIFLGSPSIISLPNGSLLASHDTFMSWGVAPVSRPATYLYQSDNGGASWSAVGAAPDQYWSSLFMANGLLYLLGTTHDHQGAGVAISMSGDGGASWKHSILFKAPPECAYATGPTPVLSAGGYYWRGMELWCGALRWPQSYQALLIFAPRQEGVDLLDPKAWQMTQPVQFSRQLIPAWMPGPVSSGGFLEGNAVATPQGGVALLLRCRVYDTAARMYTLQYACLYRLKPPLTHEVPTGEPDGSGGSSGHASVADVAVQGVHLQQWLTAGQASLRAAREDSGAQLPELAWEGFVSMPGGGNKFTVRYDNMSRLYISLTNPSIDRYGANPDARNILTLVYSPNLIDWRIATTLLVPNDQLSWEDSLQRTSYQYADWQVDGEDLVVAIRAAYNGAHNFHDSNWLAFKRIQGYRQYLPKQP